MRWSTRIMIPGMLLIALGFVPLAFGHLNFDTLETAGSFFAVGVLVFLIGLMLRKVAKSMQ